MALLRSDNLVITVVYVVRKERGRKNDKHLSRLKAADFPELFFGDIANLSIRR